MKGLALVIDIFVDLDCKHLYMALGANPSLEVNGEFWALLFGKHVSPFEFVSSQGFAPNSEGLWYKWTMSNRILFDSIHGLP